MRKKRQKRTRNKILPLLIYMCVVTTLIAVLVVTSIGKRITDKITMEAGEAFPAAEDFFKSTVKNAAYVTDISAISANVPGIYDVEIKLNKRIYRSKLEIIDTTAPTGVLKQVDLLEGEVAEAEQFFESISDATDVMVSFKTRPDFTKKNSQPVVLVLTDTSGNTTEYQSYLRISKLKETVRVEASNDGLDLNELLKPGVQAAEISPVGEPVKLNKVGRFPLQVSVDGEMYETTIEVVDTIPPTGSPVNMTAWQGDNVDPGSFISEINDITTVKVEYQSKPDFNRTGEQKVTLVLTDEGNNKTLLDALLTIEADTVPPKIYGAKKVTAYIGQPVSYKKGVYAEDNRDGIVPITVDSSKVNLKVEGQYPVYYTAVDSSGNSVTEEFVVTVKNQSVTMEELEKLADQVLAEITTEDMTLREKAWEIYQYVNKRVTYTGFSDKTDWMKEAYSGIVKGVGDCFTYYSMSHLLLNRIGIQTLSVERASIGDEARHYWHLVNYGEGWYHFDACIHRPPLVSFMLTDAELDAYSKRVGKNDYYYRFNKENYPRTPEK